MAIFDPEVKKWYCECCRVAPHCDKEVKDFLSEFAPGHNLKTEEGRKRISGAVSKARSGLCFLLDEDYLEGKSKAQLQAYREDPTYANRISESLSGGFDSNETRRRKSKGQLQSYRDDPTRAVRQGESQVGKLQFLDKEYCKSVSEGLKQAYIDDPTLKERTGGSNAGRVMSDGARASASRARREFYDGKEGKRWIEEHSGEGHPNWKGGSDRNYGYSWGAERETIIIRDGYTCQGCGVKGDFSSLEVHHIDGDIGNWNEKNEITVCHSCNMKAAQRNQEEYWFNFYTKKIEETYVGVQVEKLWKISC